MTNTQDKKRIRSITLNGIMLAVIIALQVVNIPKLLTGVIVNSILVFVSIYIGLKSAFVLCLLSPFCGFITGHVPILMYPVLPMIALGNLLLVIVLSKLAKRSLILRLLIPACIKALVIGVGGMLLINIFIPDKLSDFLLFTVLGIQFFTAVPGVFLGIKLAEKFKL